MRKIYIAGKITGLDDFKKNFKKAEEMLVKKGYAVMNPAVLNTGFEHEEYMHVCYAMIDTCDTVYFLTNWKDSKGAKMEMQYAKTKELKIILEEKYRADK